MGRVCEGFAREYTRFSTQCEKRNDARRGLGIRRGGGKCVRVNFTGGAVMRSPRGANPTLRACTSAAPRSEATSLAALPHRGRKTDREKERRGEEGGKVFSVRLDGE